MEQEQLVNILITNGIPAEHAEELASEMLNYEAHGLWDKLN